MGERRGRGLWKEDNSKSAASVSATVLHSISGCHDNCCHDSFAVTKQRTHTQRPTLRVFCAGSLEPMAMSPGPPMLQKLFRCSDPSTGTVDTAKSCREHSSRVSQHRGNTTAPTPGVKRTRLQLWAGVRHLATMETRGSLRTG